MYLPTVPEGDDGRHVVMFGGLRRDVQAEHVVLVEDVVGNLAELLAAGFIVENLDPDLLSVSSDVGDVVSRCFERGAKVFELLHTQVLTGWVLKTRTPVVERRDSGRSR